MRGSLPDQTRVSQVHLRIARLERALEFYSGVLGLHVAQPSAAHAVLSAGPKQPGLVVLSEDRAAAPRPPRSTGLFHLALRFPTRRALAQAYQRLADHDYPIFGASDHGVSEAIYLSDPEGNGIELYTDRPRSQWRWNHGQVAMVTEALDLENLVASIGSEPKTKTPMPVDLGHIHLQVADLAQAERFYSDFLGLAVTQRTYPGALFFAAGGYHHHIAANIWAGRTAAPANSVGLVSYRIEVPVAEILYCLNHRAPLLGYESRTGGDSLLQIRDPNGTWLEVHSIAPLVAAPRQSAAIPAASSL